MLLAPLFFSSNLIFGRSAVEEVSPFTLAFIRWLAVALALLPFMLSQTTELRPVIRRNFPRLLLLAFLGMWVCGGCVYLALQWTSATNATLIYTTSSVLILLLEGAFKGRPIGLRELAGSLLAILGIVTIVLRGDLAALLALDFNAGDLIIMAAALAWAIYSILYRAPGLQQVSNTAMLGLLAAIGAVLLFPAAAVEWSVDATLPSTARGWGSVAGIVVFSSLLAFSSFQFGLRSFGPSLAGVFMYLMPPYGVMLAVLLLGETLQTFHAVGVVLVMGGVILATFPIAWLRRKVGWV